MGVVLVQRGRHTFHCILQPTAQSVDLMVAMLPLNEAHGRFGERMKRFKQMWLRQIH